jgi:hypothetical protein
VIEKLTGNGFLITTAAALAAKDAEIAELRGVWMAGEPPTPWRDEWFIAKTIHGDKVVLRALPEEWTYDYTTADHTYMIAANIVCWMQFPDSDYIAPTAEEAPIFAAKDAEIARLTAAIREVAGASGCCDACPCHMRATRKARAALTGEDRG